MTKSNNIFMVEVDQITRSYIALWLISLVIMILQIGQLSKKLS